jgi:hypothetical protein
MTPAKRDELAGLAWRLYVGCGLPKHEASDAVEAMFRTELDLETDVWALIVRGKSLAHADADGRSA